MPRQKRTFVPGEKKTWKEIQDDLYSEGAVFHTPGTSSPPPTVWQVEYSKTDLSASDYEPANLYLHKHGLPQPWPSENPNIPQQFNLYSVPVLPHKDIYAPPVPTAKGQAVPDRVLLTKPKVIALASNIPAPPRSEPGIIPLPLNTPVDGRKEWIMAHELYYSEPEDISVYYTPRNLRIPRGMKPSVITVLNSIISYFRNRSEEYEREILRSSPSNASGHRKKRRTSA